MTVVFENQVGSPEPFPQQQEAIMEMIQNKVKFLDLDKINKRFSDELLEATSDVIQSGQFILSGRVSAFEKSFSDYIGTDYCLGVGNGLDALCLIFQAYIEMGRLKPGDKVLVPATTYIASIMAVSRCGLIPEFVEPDLNNYNMDPAHASKKISKEVKAILLVHLYGRPVDFPNFKKLADEHQLLLIEDCAQSIGADIGTNKTGNLGDAAGFSFYPIKNLGALGDGGAVTSNSEELNWVITKLRNHGSVKKYHNDYIGHNSRLDELQAAYLSIKLEQLDADNQRRREIAHQYINKINNDKLVLPLAYKSGRHAWHIFVIRTANRSTLQEYLKESGIETMIHYPIPPHKQIAYHAYRSLDLPITERIHNEVLSLPISPVMEDEEVNLVIDAINNY